MIFDGSCAIAAERQRVWDFVLDVNSLKTCLPGVERITQVDERTFDGVILAAVGPISGNFSYRAQIVEATPPSEVLAQLDGTDSVTKSTLHADVRMRLDEPASRETAMTYHADVRVNGRLAILGDMVLRTTASLLLDEFTRRLRQQLEAPARQRSDT